MKYTTRSELAEALKSLTHREINSVWHPLKGADNNGFYAYWELSSRTQGL